MRTGIFPCTAKQRAFLLFNNAKLQTKKNPTQKKTELGMKLGIVVMVLVITYPNAIVPLTLLLLLSVSCYTGRQSSYTVPKASHS